MRTHKTVLYTHKLVRRKQRQSQKVDNEQSTLHFPTLSGGDDLLFYCSTKRPAAVSKLCKRINRGGLHEAQVLCGQKPGAKREKKSQKSNDQCTENTSSHSCCTYKRGVHVVHAVHKRILPLWLYGYDARKRSVMLDILDMLCIHSCAQHWPWLDTQYALRRTLLYGA